MIYDRFDLDSAMIPFWKGDTVINESLMFLGKTGEARLMYKADSIISVRSADLLNEFQEGIDYIYDKDTNILKRIESGKASYADIDYYYSANPDYPNIVFKTLRDGTESDTRYDEYIYRHQVFVTYTHSDSWTEPVQESYADVFTRFINKLDKGEDVTVFYYGDSITYGASATYTHNYGPMTPTWPIMVTEYLAEQYNYNVRYISTGIDGTPPVHGDIYGRTGGTVTYVNTAVGGWQITDGINKYDVHIKPYIEKYGCDLFVMAFGMNDGWREPDDEKQLQKDLADMILKDCPKTSLLLLSTMVPNPDSSNGWYGKQALYEPVMSDLAASYRENGYAVGIARMTSMSLSILKYKHFRDYTGNNINHPNDYFARIYAQTVYRAITGK